MRENPDIKAPIPFFPFSKPTNPEVRAQKHRVQSNPEPAFSAGRELGISTKKPLGVPIRTQKFLQSQKKLTDEWAAIH
jgi:hypothetical protein